MTTKARPQLSLSDVCANRWIELKAFENHGEFRYCKLRPGHRGQPCLFVRWETIEDMLDKNNNHQTANELVLIEAQAAEIARLRKALPVEMPDSVIVFKTCEKGHGWLTSTNWVDGHCQACEVEELKRSTDAEIASQAAEIDALRAEVAQLHQGHVVRHTPRPAP